MTILYDRGTHRGIGYSDPEASAAYIATLGLLHLVRSLISALDDVDYRLAVMAERLNQAGIPAARLGAHRYGAGAQFGLFSLLPEPFRSDPERDEAEPDAVSLEVAPIPSETKRDYGRPE